MQIPDRVSHGNDRWISPAGLEVEDLRAERHFAPLQEVTATLWMQSRKAGRMIVARRFNGG